MSAHTLILYTGGTFGMVESDQGLAPASGIEARLRQALAPRLDALPSFDVLELETPLDSSNLQPQHWSELAALLRQHWERYQSFVIIHGTDTMAYTASMLSYLFVPCEKPIVITGSQLPLAAPRTDAIANLELSLTVAAERKLTDVALVFGGRILKGCRSQKVSSQALQGFDSPNEPWLGEGHIDLALTAKLDAPNTSDKTSTRPDANPLATRGVGLAAQWRFHDESVAVVHITPSVPSYVLDALLNAPQCKGVILVAYGAGNVPDTTASVQRFLTKAHQQGIHVVCLSQCAHGGMSIGAYAASQLLAQNQVLNGYDMTLEAAFCKLHYLFSLGLNDADIRRYWARNLVGEMRLS